MHNTYGEDMPRKERYEVGARFDYYVDLSDGVDMSGSYLSDHYLL